MGHRTIDADHAGHEVRHEPDVVRHHEDRHAFAQLVEQPVQLILNDDVDIGRRFVKQQQAWMRRQGAGDQHALALAPGQIGEGPVALIGQANIGQSRVGGRAIFLSIASEQTVAVEASHENHLYRADWEIGVVAEVLRHVADIAPIDAGLAAEHLDAPAVGAQHTKQKAQ